MIVKVVKYNPKWPRMFELESEQLKIKLGTIIYKIHHIGSTSVPGLKAKPIIDILLEVSSLAALDAKSVDMESLGYEVKGELGILGRRYFRKGGDHRTHQIHAFLVGDSNLHRHLVFRDYLIAHPAVADEYAELKSDIAARCNDDIEQYCDEKDTFVQLHEQRALAWYDEKQ